MHRSAFYVLSAWPLARKTCSKDSSQGLVRCLRFFIAPIVLVEIGIPTCKLAFGMATSSKIASITWRSRNLGFYVLMGLGNSGLLNRGRFLRTTLRVSDTVNRGIGGVDAPRQQREVFTNVDV